MDISDILERAAERLMDDESLRSNLDDEQATLALNRALSWLENQVGRVKANAVVADPEQDIAQAVNALRAVNRMMGETPLSDLPAALDNALPLTGALPRLLANEPIPAKVTLLRGALNRFRVLWRRATARGQPKS